MYPVSEAYKQAIANDAIQDKIVGTITLVDDTTINFDSNDIYDDSFSLSEACTSGGDIEIGSVVAAELNLTLSTSPEDPYSLDGAKIIPQYGLKLANGNYEYVPLGVFYIDEPKRHTDEGVIIKAFDGMMLLDEDLDELPSVSLPYSLLAWISSKTGVPLASTALEIAALPNGETPLAFSEQNPIKTYRDILMWIAQATGSFARMRRTGGMELIAVKNRAPVRTIGYRDQYDDTDISDNYVKITKLTTTQAGEPITVGTDGMTMQLEENPLWSEYEKTVIETLLENILDNLTTAEYTPGKAVFVGDPAIQPGDYIKVARSDDDLNSITLYITSSVWNPHGRHTLTADGKSAIRRSKYSQPDKRASAILQLLKATKAIADSNKHQSDLLNNAIGGNIFIRQTPGETNEILMMDAANPEEAVKIWRWNMNGLGYSDNVTGADNPDREYTIAMTMDGAISANFITTGVLRAILIEAVEINCNDKFIVTADGTVTAVQGNIGGWNISERGLTARDTTDTPTPTIIVQLGIQEDIIDGGWYYETKTGYDRYTYVFDLTLYRNYTITHTGVADKAILTNEFPPTDVPPTRTRIYSFVDHNLSNPIPDTNKWCYLVIDTDDANFTISITAAAPSEDTSGMLSSNAAKGHAQVVMGVEASMPSPMFVGQSNIRHFAGKSPGETPDSNVDVPFYTTETGLTKVGDLIVEGGIYSESADGKYVFIKDGKIIFGDKNTRNIFEISLYGLLQKYFYGSVQMPGFEIDLHYGYPGSYGDVSNANIT